VAGFAVGAEHFGVGVSAVFVDVVAERLCGDRLGVDLERAIKPQTVAAIGVAAVDPLLLGEFG
jgi:hypothetical protein